MTANFPSQVDRSGDPSFAGTVTVTNIAKPLSGVTSPEADIFVARAGTVVAVPPAKDSIAVSIELATGGSRVFTARGSLRQCQRDGTGDATGPLIAAGRYEVYAIVVVDDDTGTGNGVAAIGGPWHLEVT